MRVYQTKKRMDLVVIQLQRSSITFEDAIFLLALLSDFNGQQDLNANNSMTKLRSGLQAWDTFGKSEEGMPRNTMKFQESLSHGP